MVKWERAADYQNVQGAPVYQGYRDPPCIFEDEMKNVGGNGNQQQIRMRSEWPGGVGHLPWELEGSKEENSSELIGIVCRFEHHPFTEPK